MCRAKAMSRVMVERAYCGSMELFVQLGCCRLINFEGECHTLMRSGPLDARVHLCLADQIRSFPCPHGLLQCVPDNSGMRGKWKAVWLRTSSRRAPPFHDFKVPSNLPGHRFFFSLTQPYCTKDGAGAKFRRGPSVLCRLHQSSPDLNSASQLRRHRRTRVPQSSRPQHNPRRRGRTALVTRADRDLVWREYNTMGP
jgi:hypothetical protein